MSREEIIAAMKQRVFEANLELPQYGLVKLTWGNVSEINRDLGVIVIKPSGVNYETMQADQMVVTDLTGKVLAEISLQRRLSRTSLAVAAAKTSSVRPNAQSAVFFLLIAR